MGSLLSVILTSPVGLRARPGAALPSAARGNLVRRGPRLTYNALQSSEAGD